MSAPLYEANRGEVAKSLNLYDNEGDDKCAAFDVVIRTVECL